MAERRHVVVSARVHPGETNASYVMEGVLRCLTGQDELGLALRRQLVWHVLPMLNPDGVAAGNYRCSLAGVDLNRQWALPHSHHHPEIYAAKALLQGLLAEHGSVALFCDLHGHSVKRGNFLFGCEAGKAGPIGARVFPQLLSRTDPSFDLQGCKYREQRSKANTGRVVVSQLGVDNSYTLESSLGGAGLGPLAGMHFNTQHYYNLGVSLCEAILAAFGTTADSCAQREAALAALLASDQWQSANALAFPQATHIVLPCESGDDEAEKGEVKKGCTSTLAAAETMLLDESDLGAACDDGDINTHDVATSNCQNADDGSKSIGLESDQSVWWRGPCRMPMVVVAAIASGWMVACCCGNSSRRTGVLQAPPRSPLT
jgi:hypothetical protein